MPRPTTPPSRPAPAPRRLKSWLQLEPLEAREVPSVAGLGQDDSPALTPAGAGGAVTVTPADPTGTNLGGGGGCPTCGGIGCTKHIINGNTAYAMATPKLPQAGFNFVSEYGPATVGEEIGGLPNNPFPPSGGAPFPLSETFNLSSNPGATKTIYLDFDGHTTTGTGWNSSSLPSFTTPAYNFTGQSYATFENNELIAIQRIFMRVVEDFAPFNVNVTTVAPAAGALTDSGGGDTTWGMRVVFGGTTRAESATNGDGSPTWFPGAAGGVAFLTSFRSSVDTPCFAFTETVGGFTAADFNASEVATHEVGHTLGLNHDGVLASGSSPSQGYYDSHPVAAGTQRWTPIMGAGYTNFSQWSKGDYFRANNTVEDDLSIITNSRNGFGYRADDFGNDSAAASSAVTTRGNLLAYGIIERTTDTDWFTFTSFGPGDFVVDVNTFPYSPNLNVRVELYRADGTTLVAFADPLNSLGARLTVNNLAAGTYFIKIDGVGEGDPLTGSQSDGNGGQLGSGFSEYGSLGQYQLIGTYNGTPPQSVGGRVYRDVLGDGSVTGDPARPNTRVFVDLDGDKVFDANEPTAVSDSRGDYTITDVPVGSWFVLATAPDAYLSSPGAAGRPVVVTPVTAVTDGDLGLAQGLTVNGRVFFDVDGDGAIGATEPGAVGLTVYADVNDNNQFDAGEPSTTTQPAGASPAGSYTLLTGLPPGTYTVRLVLPNNTSVTAPASGSYSVTAAIPGESFDNRDFGIASPSVASITPNSPTVPPLFGTRAGGVDFLVRFALPMQGLDLAGFTNFTLSGAGAAGASITGIAPSTDGGRTYVVSVATGADGDLRLDLSNVGTIRTTETTPKPLSGPYFAGQSYLVDRTAPTAGLSGAAPDVNASRGGQTTLTFTVTYADAGTGVNFSTVSPGNVVADRGARVTAAQVVGNTVTYTVTAPGLDWANSPQGTYTIRLTSDNLSLVRDAVGNPIPAGVLGTFRVDTVLPTASLLVAPPLIGGPLAAQNTFTFDVQYADVGGTGVDAATYSIGNVVVPVGATVSGVQNLGGGRVRYTVATDETTWADSEQGFFTIGLRGGLAGVRDVLGNPVAAESFFSFYAVDTVAPDVFLSGRTLLNTRDYSARVSAADAGLAGIAANSSAFFDVDLNRDGAFTGAELGYGKLLLAGGSGIADGTVAPGLPAEGRFTLRARVLDSFGNEGLSEEVEVVVDLTAPTTTLSLTSPTPSGNPRPEFSVTASDPQLADASAGTGVTPGTRVFVDVDRNNDGDFTDPGETGYFSTPLTSASVNFTLLPALLDGTYRLRSRVVDAVGNSGTSAPVTVVVDTAAPTVTLTAPARTANRSPQITVVANDNGGAGFAAGARAFIDADLNNDGDFADAGETGFASVALVGGTVTTSLAPGLPDGTVRLRARVSDALGNAGDSSPVAVTVDATPPAAPLLQDIQDGAGRTVAGRTVRDNRPVVIGTAEPGSAVTLVDALTNRVLGTAAAGVAGNWRIALTAPLPDGRTELTAFAADADGNVGPRGGSLSVTVDTVAPAAPLIAGFVGTPGAAPAPATAAVAGTLVGSAEPAASVLVSQNGVFLATVTAGPDGQWALPLANLDEGQDGFTARALDVAGNLGATSEGFTLTVDRSVPTTPETPTPPTNPGSPPAAPGSPPTTPGNTTSPPTTTPTSPPPTTPSGDPNAGRFVTGSGAGNPGLVTLYNAATGQELYQMAVYGTGFRGGVRPVLGSLVGSGTPDIVTAPGSGTAAVIKIFDGDSGTETRSILAYESSFLGGAFVAAADLNGDGVDDVITSPDVGGGPRVRIFDGATGGVIADFFAIDDANFRGGVRIALGDLDGDGVPELIAGAGFGGGPRVSIFTGASILAGQPEKLVPDFFAFEQTLRNGVYVSAGDVNGDGIAEVAYGAGPGGSPRVYIADGASLAATGAAGAVILANFFAGDPSNRGGVPVTLRDFDSDGRADLIVGSGEGAAGGVLAYSATNLLAGNFAPSSTFDVELEELSGVYVG